MSAGEGWTCAASTVVSAVLMGVWVIKVGRPATPVSVQPSNRFLEFERDRVLGSAKGLGSAAIGFLTVLVTAYFEKHAGNVPGFFRVCYVSGCVACIAISAWLSMSTREYVKGIQDKP